MAAFLRAGMPADAFLLDALEGGPSGFHAAWEGDRLAGAVFQRRGAVSAASRSTRHAAEALARGVAEREAWTSVVGPEEPCRVIVDTLRETRPFRVDRVQTFMAAARGDRLAPGDPRLRAATAADLESIVPLVTRYRIEDGLSRPDDDHGAWIRAHTQERIQMGQLFLVRDDGDRPVFTGAFNFSGRWGAGLGGIYTVPEARGRGIATRAVAAMCRIALERGPSVSLHVEPRNAAAIRAYEKAGLRRAGEFRLTFR